MEEVVQTLAEEGCSRECGQYRLEKAPDRAAYLPDCARGAGGPHRPASRRRESVLQQLAVMGREFPLSLVRQVVAQPEEDLYRLLASLQRKSFSTNSPRSRSRVPLQARADAGSGLRLGVEERRKAYMSARAGHRSTLPRPLDEHYSELAHHYSRSGNTEKAVEYLHLAGQQAVQRSANVEAITHLTTALELLNTLPDTRERAQQELLLHLTLGVPLQATRGYSSPEVKATYTRARELCQQVGETPTALSGPLWGCGRFIMCGASFSRRTSWGSNS